MKPEPNDVHEQQNAPDPLWLLRKSSTRYPDPILRVRWLLSRALRYSRHEQWYWAYRFARKAAFWTCEYEIPEPVATKAVAAANWFAYVLERRNPGSAPVTFVRPGTGA